MSLNAQPAEKVRQPAENFRQPAKDFRQTAQDFRQAAEPFGRLAAEHLGLAAEPGLGGKEMAWSDTTTRRLLPKTYVASVRFVMLIMGWDV